MWARIENGVVVETITENPEGRFHPSIAWISCPGDVEHGMIYNGATFEAAPAYDAERLASDARIERDRLLRDIYDIGVIAIGRALRLTSVDAEITAINAKLAELDAYAVALLNVPQQAAFPVTINWPEAPTP